MGGTCSTQNRCEKRAQNICRNTQRADHSKDLGVEYKIKLERILWKQGEKVWTGFIWLRRGTNGGLL
jgi:hypothetical protein